MPLKAKRKVILAKINAGAYGTDAAPAAATDAMLVRNFQPRPLQLQYERREFDVPYFGNKGQIVAGQMGAVSFELEMAGGGAAGTIPKYDPLLQACGMSATNTPGVSQVYAPITTAEKDLTLYWYQDGRLHKLLGAFGSVVMRIAAGQVPVFAFSFIGLHVQPTDVALPTPTLTGFVKPVAVNAANTTPFTLHAFAGKFRELSIEVANALPYRNLPNSEAVRFVDRMVRGSVRLEKELVATKDWETIIKAGTLGALAVTQGTVAGNRVAIAAANVQLTDPEESEEDNIAMFSMAMELQPSAAGNDELSITVT